MPPEGSTEQPRSVVLDDEDCPLNILMQHPTTQGKQQQHQHTNASNNTAYSNNYIAQLIPGFSISNRIAGDLLTTTSDLILK